MAPRLKTGAKCFDVRMGGTDPSGTAFNNRISVHATMELAWRKVLDVMHQWAAAQGAINGGTEISIVDTRDGGKLFTATYLGFSPDLLEQEAQ